MVLHPDTSNSRELFLSLEQRDTAKNVYENPVRALERSSNLQISCWGLPLDKLNRRLGGKRTIELAPYVLISQNKGQSEKEWRVNLGNGAKEM